MSEFEKLIEALLQQCVELRKRHPSLAFMVWTPKLGEASIMFLHRENSKAMASIGVRLDSRDHDVFRRGRIDECIKAIDDFIEHSMAA